MSRAMNIMLKMEQNHLALVPVQRAQSAWFHPRALKFVNNSASSAQRTVDATTTGMCTGGEKKKKRRLERK